ncbi:MAG: hypothetical protein EPN74_03140 [Rhodanobacter sp.]|nr:MAG: hypothetical protein EPN74_03140 [Rhodanobacter sp.]
MSTPDTAPGVARPVPALSENDIQARPSALLGLAQLLRAAYRDEDLTVHVPDLVERGQADDAYAMLDLALILQLRFQKEQGLAVLREALKIRRSFRLCTGQSTSLRVLVIKVPGDLMANTPLECILENAGFTLDVLYVDEILPWPTVVPDHELAFVAISEADAHRSVLAQLAAYMEAWPRPVLNPAHRIPQLSRTSAFEMLREVPGLCVAATCRISRANLQQLVAEPSRQDVMLPQIRFPLILRPIGSHAGTDLCKIDGWPGVDDYLQRVQAAEFFVANFIEYASGDGLFRKYRVVLIEGRPFVCHMGISRHWMVHYPYDEMRDDAARRAEEAACMASFDEGFARRHGAAIAALQERFELDYVGFDCAETRDGKLLIFEMANALVIHAMDDPVMFPYKAAQMRKVFDAFSGMLRRRAATEH